MGTEGGSGSHASDRLLANQSRILNVWIERVRRDIPAAQGERRMILVDTIPQFLRHLAEALSPHHVRPTASEGTTIPQEHGGERARVTRYTPEELIREYQLLRNVLLETLDEGPHPLTGPERALILSSIDQAICHACTAYFLVYSGLREQFIASLTHDLRNPLASAKLSAELILRKAESQEVRRNAERVLADVDRADRLVQDLLDASTVQAGERLTLQLAECDLVAVARLAVSNLVAQHGDRFQLVAAEPLPGVWSAEGLRRAIENLGGNAVKYGSEDRPIVISLHSDHGRAMVRVHNHGSYIPVEEQESLFLAFRRTHSARQSGKPGWGLGLALVRGVAESHGGSISVDSLPERGTTFIIDIPLDARPYQSMPVTR